MKPSILVFVATLWCAASGSASADDRLIDAAKIIEAQLGAQLGLAVYDTADGTWALHNADQRFPMASTFKVSCAALLASGVPDEPTLQVGDLKDYSPVTEGMVGQTVSAYQMCDATMRTSDNTAANLVLKAFGGTQAVTQYVRTLGDTTTQLDRWEPELNEGAPGDPRDTTTPRAMAESLNRLMFGSELGAPERDLLASWLHSNEVGGPLLRAGIPGDWAIADRTGAGGNGTRGIVAAMWPSGVISLEAVERVAKGVSMLFTTRHLLIAVPVYSAHA